MKIAKSQFFNVFRRTALVLALLAGAGRLFAGEIHEAALAGDMVKVVELVRADPKLVFTNGQTEWSKKLLGKRWDNATAKQRKQIKVDSSPLFFAVVGGHKEVAEYLLANRADVNSKGVFGITPLIMAIYSTNLDMAKLLIAHQADVNASDDIGRTPLRFAVLRSSENLVALLLTNKAKISKADHMAGIDNPMGDGYVGTLTFNPGIPQRLYMQEPVRTFETAPIWSTPLLMIATGSGDMPVAKLLVAAHANIDARDGVGWTALHQSALYNQLKMATFLLEHQADVNAKADSGVTPLLIAANYGNVAVLKLLIDHKAKPNIKAANGATALHYAVANGYKEVVELLVAAHADVNLKDDRGYRPLLAARANGYKEIADFLQQHGAHE